ncbi:Os11g0147600 [Oryza sativa Japonica Group]|uniref:Expressed protein n=1 Tax=Oryza sativa subsp. japonica TaxID=39947 RepID=Q2RAL1_ORYSJ|nr:expressed protein [Oryza sativa Japonica Group]KAB8114220.1 hypothetical protein EE612_053477 [Oryza sativa]KAF2909507.1 hypothetical protein DAI22_11g031100 [Oryza sativa Japonica Group]BAG99167.1 unnamed protein product [Oryza sativa Japonica Group]BAT12677.1 Os11g0147600 [Oryza sativa Japonica Group]
MFLVLIRVPLTILSPWAWRVRSRWRQRRRWRSRRRHLLASAGGGSSTSSVSPLKCTRSVWESGVSVVVAPTPAPTVFSSVDSLHQQEVLHFLALSSVKKIGDMNWYEHIDDTSIESDMNLFMSTPCTYI